MMGSIVGSFGSLGLASLGFLALKASTGAGSALAKKRRAIRWGRAGWLMLGASIVPWLTYADTIPIGAVTWVFCIPPLAALFVVVGGAWRRPRTDRIEPKRRVGIS